MLEVSVYGHPNDEKPLVIEDIDYVSLFNGDTHGPPALVAPARNAPAGGSPRASVGDRVLYVNTTLVPMFEIERKDD